MRFVIFDPVSGEITGRISCSARQAVQYPQRREVTGEEYDERPELFRKVNVADVKAPLVALSEAEARAKGASEEFIAAKLAEGKIRR